MRGHAKKEKTIVLFRYVMRRARERTREEKENNCFIQIGYEEGA